MCNPRTIESGAAGVALVNPSASRASTRRTIEGVRFVKGRRGALWRPDPDLFAMRWHASDGAPHLVVDTGTFTGAVVNKIEVSEETCKWSLIALERMLAVR